MSVCALDGLPEDAHAGPAHWFRHTTAGGLMQDEIQDPAITPLAGRYAGRTERFLERVFAETPQPTAMVLSSGNGLRFRYVCVSCDIQSLTESFDKGLMERRASLHDALCHRESAA